jgi:geranylgeranyl diphosphate synthase, type I
MDAREELKKFKARLDPRIAAYFDSTIAKAKEEDELVVEALEHVKTMTLSGGKRLRPALVYYGYRAAGGTDEERILDTAVAIELIHMFLLIHDDIIDRDALRHGEPTLHERYRRWGVRHLGLADPDHFGDSIALIVGDMLFALGNDIIFRSGFPHQNVYAALSKMQGIVSRTVIGQARDIYIEYRGSATEAEILKMYENKTARYTVEGPLHLGLLLAGGSEALAANLSRFALPLGVAFQIQDDILGIFGDAERIGKPVASDLKEGKITFLVSHILEQGSSAARSETAALLRKGAALTRDDIARFRAIVTESGALATAQTKVQTLVKESLQALAVAEPAPLPPADAFLRAFAEYMAVREH